MQSYGTKPKRRLFELMKSQGLQANQQVTFLSDVADDVRELPLYLSPESEHWLDWFHPRLRNLEFLLISLQAVTRQKTCPRQCSPGGVNLSTFFLRV